MSPLQRGIASLRVICERENHRTPRSLYIGTNLYFQLKMDCEAHQWKFVEPNEEHYTGLRVYVIQNDPEHLRIV